MKPTSPSLAADASALDELGSSLNRVIDPTDGVRTSDLIDEVSELLWLVSSLDPDAERLLRTSGYIGDLLANSNDEPATASEARSPSPGGSDAIS